MAYIDANDLFKCETCRRYKGDKCFSLCENGECYSPSMSKIPTADVVPKSEVERLEKEFEQLRDNNDYLVKEAVFAPMERANTIIAVRQEVARHIFEEIDNLFDKYPTLRNIGGAAIAELKKKYTEGAYE